MTTMATNQTTLVSCPQCNAPHALVWLGQYGKDASPWLQWASTVTHYYMCLACQTITPLVEIQGRSAATHDEAPARSGDVITVELAHLAPVP